MCKKAIRKTARKIQKIDKSSKTLLRYDICSDVAVYLTMNGNRLDIRYNDYGREGFLYTTDTYNVLEYIEDFLLAFLFVCSVFTEAYMKGFNPSMKLANFNIENTDEYSSRAYSYLKEYWFIFSDYIDISDIQECDTETKKITVWIGVSWFYEGYKEEVDTNITLSEWDKLNYFEKQDICDKLSKEVFKNEVEYGYYE